VTRYASIPDRCAGVLKPSTNRSVTCNIRRRSALSSRRKTRLNDNSFYVKRRYHSKSSEPTDWYSLPKKKTSPLNCLESLLYTLLIVFDEKLSFTSIS